MKSIIWGIILLAVGIVFVIKTDWILRINGRVMWAEMHLGTAGGTRLFYKIIGFIVIFIAFLLISGLADDFFNWIFGPIFNLGM